MLARFAGALIRSETGLLLVKETNEGTDRAQWTYPSGSVEPGESAVEAAARELVEESGCIVASTRLRPASKCCTYRLPGSRGGQPELISVAWNFSGSSTEARLDPRDPDVEEGRWFRTAEGIEALGLHPHVAVRQPAVEFLRTGRLLEWSYQIPHDAQPADLGLIALMRPPTPLTADDWGA